MDLAVKVVREGDTDASIWVNGKKYEVYRNSNRYFIETFREDVGRAKSFGGAIGEAIAHYIKFKDREKDEQ